MDATEVFVDLRLWSESAFRTVSFTIAVVFVFHLRGTLRESLATLNTMIGFAAFAIVWMTTLFATRAGRLYYQRRQASSTYPASRFESTTVAGSLNGACVYAVLALVAALALHTPQAVAAIAVFSVIGVTIAAAIGGFVGIAYGASEACLLRVSRALVDTDEPQP